MADKFIPGFDQQVDPYAHVHGNASSQIVEWDVSAFTADESLALMKLAQGMKITHVDLTVNDPSNAGVTLDVGYERLNGDDDFDYFISAQAISAATHVDSRGETMHRPFLVDDEAYLIARPKAAITAKTVLVFEVHTVYVGNL